MALDDSVKENSDTKLEIGKLIVKIDEVEYKRDFISYDKQPLYRYKLEIYGIKNECCKDISNICYTENNEFLQCIVCNRLFKWSRIKSKVRFWQID